jgi:hypothetical protein
MRIAVFRVVVGAALLAAGYVGGRLDAIEPVARAQAPAGRVFELRTYTTNEGMLPTLHKRFREHTTGLFTKFNMTNIGYWTPQDGPTAQNTLIYIIAHESREAAKANWAKFQADPEWIKVRTESEANGKILVKSPDSVFLVPTDYSPIK